MVVNRVIGQLQTNKKPLATFIDEWQFQATIFLNVCSHQANVHINDLLH